MSHLAPSAKDIRRRCILLSNSGKMLWSGLQQKAGFNWRVEERKTGKSKDRRSLNTEFICVCQLFMIAEASSVSLRTVSGWNPGCFSPYDCRRSDIKLQSPSDDLVLPGQEASLFDIKSR
ncbi:hypothetical protein X797_009577 [Metarhizium robertsii]|uniref:Uncharacterized protein n=2 Tax=Metarhizium robertsii TaxID=568076 RepID=A0A0B2XG78_METRA|nr:uncharacterized protein MAA_11410 [Metarhizium robertsii ARSEF 23]EXU97300.1 hypothetical protein X797_009577 [Metarhizium robertsii]KHO11019.1 hypothetical protein MAA_11410 [Metarhizium robertsii ARSEF 23]